MNYLLLIVGFALLTFSANWLINGASGLAKRLNISDLVIGLTIVAFGTSAPELVVNIIAATEGASDIALTNILGSNIINTLIILGISATIYPVACKSSTYHIEIPLSALAGLAVLILGTNFFGALPLSETHNGISRLDGIILLIVFAGLREQLSLVRVPKGMDGMPIALVTAGLLALAFMGFSGVDKGIAMFFN